MSRSLVQNAEQTVHPSPTIDARSNLVTFTFMRGHSTMNVGAAQIFGCAVSHLLASSSKYHVLVSSWNGENASAAVEQLVSEGSSADSVMPSTLDVTDDTPITAAAQSVQDKFGSLDILINDAGPAMGPEDAHSMCEAPHSRSPKTPYRTLGTGFDALKTMYRSYHPTTRKTKLLGRM